MSWAVRAACGRCHPPGASAVICSLPPDGHRRVSPVSSALCPLVEAAAPHQPWPRQLLPTLCFTRLVLKGRAVPP